MSFIDAFCRFAAASRFRDLAKSDVAVAKRAFLDGTAVCLAGAGEGVARVIRAYVEEQGGRGPAGVVGTRIRTQPSQAALANGVLAHSLDYDDVNHPMMGHPTAVLLPVIYALADQRCVSGKEGLLAYGLGLELGAKLGRIVNPEHYEQGWHATSTLGALAAAATAARILRLKPDRIRMALGIASSQASGLRRNFGTMTKPFHAGHAARCGLEAAWLASRGFTASDEILDGPMGWFALFGGISDPDQGRIRELAKGLGRPFELTSSGLAVKQYPCCAGSHPALDGVLSLLGRTKGPLDGPPRVVLRVHPLLPRMMIYDSPRNPLEAKFSLRYCVAAAMADRKVNLATFSEAGLRRKDVTRWMERIEIHPDLGDTGKKEEIPTRAMVSFQWSDGRREECCVDRPLGSPERPLSDRAMEEKFRECASRSLPSRRIGRLLGLFAEAEKLKDLRELTRRLQPPVRRRASARRNPGQTRTN